jgi:hypothetical protein
MTSNRRTVLATSPPEKTNHLLFSRDAAVLETAPNS